MTVTLEPDDPLLAGLGRADREAFAELYKRLLPLVVRTAAERLTDDRVRGRIDPQSVAQAAWVSFWKGYTRGRYYLDNWGEVINLLTKITTRKCLNRLRREQAGQRDVRREGGDAAWLPDPQDLGPDGDLVVQDMVKHVLGRFDDTQKRVIGLRLDGHPAAAVAQQVELSKRTVDRIFADFRDAFQTYLDRIAEPLLAKTDAPA